MCFLCFLSQITDFLSLKRFYARWRLFLFSFAYVLFMLFMLVGSFLERYKTSQMPSFTILLPWISLSWCLKKLSITLIKISLLTFHYVLLNVQLSLNCLDNSLFYFLHREFPDALLLYLLQQRYKKLFLSGNLGYIFFGEIWEI